MAEWLKAVDCKSIPIMVRWFKSTFFQRKAYSSKVEHFAHNETGVGSSPTKLKKVLLKFSRTSINGKLLAFQARAVGSIPTVRFCPDSSVGRAKD